MAAETVDETIRFRSGDLVCRVNGDLSLLFDVLDVSVDDTGVVWYKLENGQDVRAKEIALVAFRARRQLNDPDKNTA